MKRIIFFVILTISTALFAALPAKKIVPPKKIKVATTLSVLAALTRELGGDLVQVSSLSSATEDPHFVKAKPTFKRLVSDADLFIQIGRSLELWAPQVISASGNAKLISGAAVVTASQGVAALEVPQELSRQQGDIHPQGNPHVWLSPKAVLIMAENIKNALIKIDSAHKSNYETNFTAFKNKLANAMFGPELVTKAKNIDFLWRLHDGHKLEAYAKNHKLALGGWLKQASAINYTFLTYHTVFSYMANDFSLKIMGQIEEKSGVPPTLRYQNELVKKSKALGIKHIVAASYYIGNSKLIELIAEQIGGRKIFVNVDCEEKQSYFDFMNNLISTLVKFK
jgi:zinc/manganese transport system substrate-binding protein